ncbi:MAG: ABC transporter permease [Oscillospiraceae bacterium]|nr:ABC transporter permease [Oscillospiraceae bacterium]
MSRLPLIFKHYFRRNFSDPSGIIFFLLLPVGLIVLNMVGAIGFVNLAGESDSVDLAATATLLAAMFMVSFQFFSGDFIIHNIYNDLRGPISSRLYATPVTQRTFVIGCSLACWIFNVVQAVAIFTVASIFFDVYWGNPLIFIAVVLLTSIMCQLIGALIALTVSTRKVASGIMGGLGFFMMFLSGMLFVSFGDGPVATFITSYATPISLGYRAILFAGPILDDMSSAIFNVGILAALTVVLGGIVYLLGRRRSL